MRSKKAMWLSGLGAVVLSGGLLVGCGSGDDGAIAQGTPTDLSGVTQNWDKNLPAAQRFVVLVAFANAAVLDKNTGLVWEQAPDATTRVWGIALSHCVNRNVGGTVGWRLPSVVELKSVQDPTLPSPFVPAGVFTGHQSSYWSASTDTGNSLLASRVNFSDGLVGRRPKVDELAGWCVRGPMQESVY